MTQLPGFPPGGRKGLSRVGSKLLLSGFFLLLALGCYLIYRLLSAARG